MVVRLATALLTTPHSPCPHPPCPHPPWPRHPRLRQAALGEWEQLCELARDEWGSARLEADPEARAA